MQGIFFNHRPEEHFIGHQMAEVYKDRIYHFFLRGRKDLVIYDLGAHIGIFSLYAYKYAKALHSFEPAKKHFECLESMQKFNSMDRMFPHRQAITLKPGKVDLIHTGNVTAYSINERVDQGLGSEKVDAITIKDSLDSYGVEVVDFMKMDIEGEEAHVLGGADFREVAPRILELVVEVHPWNKKSQMQIITTLEDRGYSVRPISNQDALLYHAKRT